MKKFTIPDRFLSVDYEKDVTPQIKEIVEQFKVSRKGLYLFGEPGTGKTHTAYAVCKKLSEEGIGVRAFKAIDILRMIKEDMGFENKESDDKTNGEEYFGESGSFGHKRIRFLDGINNFRGLLFIDDFGTEKESEWVLETFYSIIDRKYEDMMPLIITSNCSLEELGKKLNDRIASRISQMCELIRMTGPDRRLTQDKYYGK